MKNNETDRPRRGQVHWHDCTVLHWRDSAVVTDTRVVLYLLNPSHAALLLGFSKKLKVSVERGQPTQSSVSVCRG